MVEHRADDARGYSTTRVDVEDQGLERGRTKGRACGLQLHEEEGQPLMARDTLGYQYTGDEDTSRMPGHEVDDEDIVERLGKIFKDMPPYTPCPVSEYSMARPRTRYVVVASASQY
jgi:hypothetical protein